MIYTLTLNPSLDKTFYVSKFKIGGLNRVEKEIIDPSGKGINISRSLSILEVPSQILAFLGGKNGHCIEDNLKIFNQSLDPIIIDNETRANIKIFDPITEKITEINEKGPIISDVELKSLKDKIFTTLTSRDILVISGSIPPNVPEEIYFDIIQWAHLNEIKCILDSSGTPFLKGIDAFPWVIKPNIDEFFQLCFKFSNKLISKDKIGIDDLHIIDKTCNILLKIGIGGVLLSLGEQGAFYYNSNKKYYVPSIPIQPKSVMGAGDALIAGFLKGYLDQEVEIKCLKWAMASATASIIQPGTKPGNLKDVETFYKQVLPVKFDDIRDLFKYF